MKKTVLFLFAASVFGVTQVYAQDGVKFSGQMFFDYSYTIQDEDSDAEGDNGFGYRRLYLTGDYGIDETYSVRARLEASDNTTLESGRPAPFVKDLSLKMKNVLAEGHEIVVGLTSPPVKGLAEKVWGFRSIEKTIGDRQKIASSRDMGILFKGRLTSGGSLKYAVMLANNSSVSREDDKHKRVYGQLEFASGNVVGTVGGDYASLENSNSSTSGNAFLAYSAEQFTVGAEGFVNSRESGSSTINTSGISTFARANVSPTIEVVGRFDYVMFENDVTENLILGGVAFSPVADVRIIPNIGVVKFSDEDVAGVTGRITFHADF